MRELINVMTKKRKVQYDKTSFMPSIYNVIGNLITNKTCVLLVIHILFNIDWTKNTITFTLF